MHILYILRMHIFLDDVKHYVIVWIAHILLQAVPFLCPVRKKTKTLHPGKEAQDRPTCCLGGLRAETTVPAPVRNL
jgi:hypothetical protein